MPQASHSSPFPVRLAAGIGVAVVVFVAGFATAWRLSINETATPAEMTDQFVDTPDEYASSVQDVRDDLYDLTRDARDIIALAEQGRVLIDLIEHYQSQSPDADNPKALEFIREARKIVDFYDNYAREFMSSGASFVSALDVPIAALRYGKSDMAGFQKDEPRYASLVSSGKEIVNLFTTGDMTMAVALSGLEEEINLLTSVAVQVPGFVENF